MKPHRGFQFCCSVLLLALTLPTVAKAQTTKLDSTIKQVTVYRDRAMVERYAAIQLNAGEQILQIDNLPPGLIQNSLRVFAKGSAKMLLGEVEIKRQVNQDAVLSREKELLSLQDKLNQKRTSIQNQVTAMDMQLRFIDRIGNDGANNAYVDALKGDVNPGKWQKAWETIGEGVHATLDQKQIAEQQRAEIDKQLQTLQRELNLIRTGRTDNLSVLVKTKTSKAGRFELALNYQIRGLGWVPVYDVRLVSETGKTQLTQKASITQRTGEDWNEVKLILSTAQPSLGGTMPEMNSWFIDFQRAVQLKQKQYSSRRAAPSAVMRSEAVQPMLAENEMMDNVAQPQTASIESSEFASEFIVAGDITVASNGEAHSFTLQQFELDTDLAVQTTPRLDRRAFLFSEITYEGEAPLLAGKAFLFRDNAYIADTHLSLLRPNEKVKFNFGVDDNVQVEYLKTKDERSSWKVIGRSKTITRHYQIKVQNLHKREMRVLLYDQIPVANDKDIDVELSEDSTKPDKQNVDGKPGVLLWRLELNKNESKTIHFAYKVTYPKDKIVPGFQ